MSIRAHLIEEIKYKEVSFSWHHPIWDYLRNGGYFDTLNEDNTGIFDVPVDVFQEVVQDVLSGKFQQEHGVFALSDLEPLEQDIAWAKQRGDEYLLYYCF